MHLRIRRAIVPTFALLLASTYALGQGIVTGSISGTTEDQQGAVVSGAQVAAKHIATNQGFKTTTNQAGLFTIRSIPIGTYVITVTAQSFRTLELHNVVVSPAADSALGVLTLMVGAASETVTVEGTVPLIETTAVQGGSTFGGRSLETAPINGALDLLAFYTPGAHTVGSQSFSNANGENFSVNGQRSRNNNFQIDGQNNNDNSVAGPAIFLGNQDALAEYSVVTNTPSVEFGRNSGSIVNIVTKSGTNAFHGSGFEYWTGSKWRSHDHLETATEPIPRYTENRWGGTIGGPIVPSKSWFFASFMQDTVKTAGSPSTSNGGLVPTPTGMTLLNGTWAGNPALNYLNNYGPYAVTDGNPQPFGTVQNVSVTGCQTPPCNGSSPAKTLSTLQVPMSDVTRTPAAPANDYEITARADFQLSSKDRFFARYLFQQTITAVGAGNVAQGGWVDVPARSQQIALDYTRTFSSRLVNQVRFSYERIGVAFEAGAFPFCLQSNLSACPTFVQFQDASMTLGIPNNLPQGRLVNNSQWQDNASFLKGRHTFKFGGEYDRQRSPNGFMPNANGTYTFNNYSDWFQNVMLTNAESLSLTNGPLKTPFKEQDAALYFGDEWRMRDNFTVHLGVRWEYWQQAVNLLSEISVQNQTGANPFWGTTLPLNVTTLPTIPNDTNNFAPYVGFAWTPRIYKRIFGEDKTVVRGSYRISYDPSFYNIYLNILSSAPVVNAGTVGPGQTGACSAPCFPTTGGTGADVRGVHLADIPPGVNPGTRNQTRVSPNFHSPYVQTWSLGIQREVTRQIAAEARYVGAHTTGEFQTINGNPQLCNSQTVAGGCVGGLVGNGFGSLVPAGVAPCATSGTPGFASGRVDCNFTNFRERINGAWSKYNGLQTEIRVRGFHGWTGAFSWTWSKTMDNASEIFTSRSNAEFAFPQNPFATNSGERSLSGLDYPHVISVWANYEFPWYKSQQGVIGHILGGWATNISYRYSPGELFTPLESRATSRSISGGPTLALTNSSCQGLFDAAFAGNSTCRPFMGNPAAPISAVGVCTNPAAADCGIVNFLTGAPTSLSSVFLIYNNNAADTFFGTPFGNMPRHLESLRGDPVSAVNFDMSKDVNLGERVKFRLEASVLNLFNTSYLGTPGNVINTTASYMNTNARSSGGSDFGGVTAAGLGRRTIVLGGHISF